MEQQKAPSGPRELFEHVKATLQQQAAGTASAGTAGPASPVKAQDPTQRRIEQDMRELLGANPQASFASWAVQSDWFRDAGKPARPKYRNLDLPESPRSPSPCRSLPGSPRDSPSPAESISTSYQSFAANIREALVKLNGIADTNSAAEVERVELQSGEDEGGTEAVSGVDARELRRELAAERAQHKAAVAGYEARLKQYKDREGKFARLLEDAEAKLSTIQISQVALEKQEAGREDDSDSATKFVTCSMALLESGLQDVTAKLEELSQMNARLLSQEARWKRDLDHAAMQVIWTAFAAARSLGNPDLNYLTVATALAVAGVRGREQE